MAIGTKPLPQGQATRHNIAMSDARTSFLRRNAARIRGNALVLFARGITAVRADWQGAEPVLRQRVYFAVINQTGQCQRAADGSSGLCL